MTRSPAGFRPEIQALRALAVLLVVGYHLYPNRLTGGYVGVDVFFVISGFLITSHLYGEVARTGRLSLSRFWARRIRRLLPASTVVLAASFLAMLAFVPHALWERTVTEIAASALYVQNWVLAASSVDYLGADNTPTLAQHFWSLSVEEQFYLVWPILIAGALILPGRKSRSRMAIVLGAVFACSLAFSVIDTARSQPSAYFHTGTRAWEFAAGGLLALVPTTWTAGTGLWRRQMWAVGSWTGIALILVAGITYTPATPFPGSYALVPVAGTLLVIAARSRGAGWSANHLAVFPPAQVIGDLSYSIYLWHWPVIVVAPYALDHDLSTVDKFGILFASLVLAALSKRFIEDPVRRAAMLSASPIRSFVLAASTIGIVLAATGTSYAVVQHQTRTAARTVASAEATNPCFGASAMVKRAECARPFTVPAKFNAAFWAADKGTLGTCDSKGIKVELCAFGETRSPVHTIALVGNSHAGHLIAGLDTYGKKHRWKVILMRKSGCSGALPTIANAASWQPCVDWSRNVNSAILAPSNGIDAVVFASNNDAGKYVARGALTPAEKKSFVSGIADNLQQLVASGKAVTVFGDVPGARGEVVPECVEQNKSLYDPCATPLASGQERDDFVAEAARRTAGAAYVDLLPYFCDQKCHVVIDGAVVYIDEHHLTASYSRSLGQYLGDEIRKQIAPRAARSAATGRMPAGSPAG